MSPAYHARSKASVPASPVRLLGYSTLFSELLASSNTPVKRMRDADTVFTGQRQNKLFLPAAQHDINRHTALTGGFLSALAASYDPDYDSTDDADGLYAGRQAYHLAKRGSVMTGFLHRIGAKTYHFTLNQHVQTIAIRQRLRSFYVEIILRHIQHLTYRQANKFW